ncbi:hypothetical protein ACFCV9_23855 [Streptomyces sp. NPDC056367]|uniref:hypothetical protein n=1 Tax=Streptomyces sp. NPDC056367 TaxID=3345797 RepID=UPI0035D64298
MAGFLSVVLALARLCADEGLFRAAGAAVARRAADRGPTALLGGVFAAASVVTRGRTAAGRPPGPWGRAR